MAWIPIDDDFPVNEGALASGVGADIETNVDHLLARRLQRHGVTYYLGPSSSGGATPPAGDSTLVGPTLDVAGTSTSDTEAIGLKLSSPPTVPIVVPIDKAWPLSARATSIRVVVGCSTDVADVDLFAVAVMNGSVTPAHPMHHLVADGDGLVDWDSAVSGNDAYRRVGTSSPSGTQDVKPVVLTIDLGGGNRTDFGFQGSGDRVNMCQVYLCILSRQGALNSTQSQGTFASFGEGGRRGNWSQSFASTWGLNPGPFHNWLKFTGTSAAEVETDADSWLPRWRGVAQIRPQDVNNPASSNTSMVIHPPIAEESAIRVDAGFEIYTCGTITIHAATAQEVGT